jgi:hypothetical protein
MAIFEDDQAPVEWRSLHFSLHRVDRGLSAMTRPLQVYLELVGHLLRKPLFCTSRGYGLWQTALFYGTFRADLNESHQ